MKWNILCCVSLALLAFGCSNAEERQAAELYDEARRLDALQEFDKEIEILRRITIEFDGTETAVEALRDIEEIRKLEVQNAKNEKAKMQSIFTRNATALDTFFTTLGRYPDTKDELSQIKSIKTDWKDVWGNPIFYKAYKSAPDDELAAKNLYVLASFGKDGLPGGSASDEDIFFQNGEVTGSLVLP